MDSKDDWSVWEVNVPRRLDPSKLFNGIAAKGSTKFTFDDPIFSVLVAVGATWSDAAKKSIVEETAADGNGCAFADTDCAANRSTFGCMIINNLFRSHYFKRKNTNKKRLKSLKF